MKGKVRIIIFICSLILLVGSLGVIGHHYWVSHQEQKDFESLEVNGGHNVTALHKKNGDIVGWLKIGGTRIDYPVMQTPDENEYYLRRNFRKESSIAGTPFMDAGSVIGTSKNYLIFGHNIKSGTMFHDLLKYEDKAFWKKHKTFSFDMSDPVKRRSGSRRDLHKVPELFCAEAEGIVRYERECLSLFL